VLRKDAKIEAIKRVPMFEACSRRELAAIASIADELDLPAGRDLTQEGARGQEFIVLIEGVVDVKRGGKVINELGPGDFAGEIALVTGRPRTATVTTRGPTRLLVLDARSFQRLLRDAPSIRSKVLEAVAARLPGD
jgi:CRP/FNR family cyclic AMP-dependent transcriptional regulator